MKELINIAIAQMEILHEELRSLKELFVSLDERDDRKIVREISRLVNKYPSNPIIINELVMVLLLCNTDELINQYDFSDIKKVLTKACEMFEKDVDLNLENFFFLRDIENDEKEATKYLDVFRARIDAEMQIKDVK